MSLPPLKGNLWIPEWTVRWESHQALRDMKSDAVMLWLAIHSITLDGERPCYASRETFGNEYTVGRRLRVLRDHNLLFDVRRPPDPHTGDHRTTLRWACNPLKVWIWESRIKASVRAAAEEAGLGRDWVPSALERLDSFKKRSLKLADRLNEETEDAPTEAVPMDLDVRQVKFDLQGEGRGGGAPQRSDDVVMCRGTDGKWTERPFADVLKQERTKA